MGWGIESQLTPLHKISLGKVFTKVKRKRVTLKFKSGMQRKSQGSVICACSFLYVGALSIYCIYVFISEAYESNDIKIVLDYTILNVNDRTIK